MVEIPDVQYARSGGVAVAYQVVGDGSQDLVFLPFLSNLYSLWQLPVFAEGTLRLAESSRLIIVNTRGMGMSDRPRGLTIEARMDDVRAVMDAVGSTRATLLGWAETSNTCGVFAATFRSVSSALSSTHRTRAAPARTVSLGPSRGGALASLAVDREHWGERGYLEDSGRRLNPQWGADPSYLEWFVWTHRLSSSPESYVEFRRMTLETNLTDVLPAIRVPTLVLAKSRMREPAAHVASLIPGARLVMLPGDGASLHENDAGLLAIESFLRDEVPPDVPDTVLATVLFTDLVGSTQLAANSAIAAGGRCSRGITPRCGASCRGSEASSWIPPATVSSPPSTAPRARSPAAGRSSPRCRRSASRSASASTPASASAWARSWRGLPSMSAPASQRRPAPATYSSPGRCEISSWDPTSCSTISASTS